MPAFWHWFVAVGTVLFIIWCIWLIGWSAKQGPQGKKDEDLTGHTWDGDLEEWNNPAPKWWLYLYFITIAWGGPKRKILGVVLFSLCQGALLLLAAGAAALHQPLRRLARWGCPRVRRQRSGSPAPDGRRRT